MLQSYDFKIAGITEQYYFELDNPVICYRIGLLKIELGEKVLVELLARDFHSHGVVLRTW